MVHIDAFQPRNVHNEGQYVVTSMFVDDAGNVVINERLVEFTDPLSHTVMGWRFQPGLKTFPISSTEWNRSTYPFKVI